MSNTDYDVVVIGAGSGGMATAKRAARNGASVAVVEERTVGGTCVARGCMPKKFLVIAAKKMKLAQRSGPRGLDTSVENVSWSDLIDHDQAVVDDLIDINRDGLVDVDGVDLIEGRGTLTGDGSVSVGDEELTYEHLVLAPGLRPSRPPIEGVEHGQTSDEFLQDRERPESMVIVGGGYIGVEFGSVMDAFDVDVEMIHRPDQLIKNHDRDVANALREEFERRGITVRTSAEARAIEPDGDQYQVTYYHDGENHDTTADRVLVATGRHPQLSGMGLEEAGVELDDRGFVKTDGALRTTADDIYAVGDVNGQYQFTPVAILEGKTVGDRITGESSSPIDYDPIPSAVFTYPEIGSAGLTEATARERHGDDITVATKSFTPFSATVTGVDESTFIKLIYAGSDDELIGVHVLGPSASELVQGFSLAMKRGATMSDLKDFPGVHPTVTEEVFSAKPD
jgi:glutathione reductase (NADPH)